MMVLYPIKLSVLLPQNPDKRGSVKALAKLALTALKLLQ